MRGRSSDTTQSAKTKPPIRDIRHDTLRVHGRPLSIELDTEQGGDFVCSPEPATWFATHANGLT